VISYPKDVQLPPADIADVRRDCQLLRNPRESKPHFICNTTLATSIKIKNMKLTVHCRRMFPTVYY